MKKILAVDDDATILRGLKIILEQKGYDVTVTSKPDEVVELTEKINFDLVILDVRMPVKSGVEIFDELKKKNLGMRFLFITAYLKSFSVNSSKMLERWQQTLADGESDVLYKPFTLDDLYLKVQGMIGPARS